MTEAKMTAVSEFEDPSPAAANRTWSAPTWTLPELPAPPPTGTVTFLLTDIVGSTPRWEAAPDAMAAAVGLHYEILDLAVARYGGVRPVEQGEGDSMVAAFARASDAVAAALDAQRTLTEQVWPAGADLVVRMAVHTGEARLREQLYYVGPSIIRTARLRSLAHGGQVLLSAVTADLLVDALPARATLLPLGIHRLKGMCQPEQVFQLAHPELPPQFPPLHSQAVRPHNLPAELTSFVGRETELAALGDLMGRHRLVTVVGTGGCGKTRIAAQHAAEHNDRFTDGTWWVDLSTVDGPAAVAPAVLGALGLAATGQDPTDRAIAYLAQRNALVVLDNCEHVVDAAAAFAQALLGACPDVRALATSREPLGITGEAVWRLAPLALPQPMPEPSTEHLLDADAVQLFLARAAAARPGFTAGAATAPVVAAICARLDGIPLAIELAAARVRALTPDRLLAGLADRFAVLTSGSRTGQPRQQTLAGCVEWSHDLLSEPERVLLRRLAVFVGSFDLDAAEAVAGSEPLDPLRVLTLLSDLVDKSLVVFDGERYRLLVTIREFATPRLEAAGEEASARAAHLRHYRALAAAASAELEAAPQVATLELLEAARGNLLAAVDWALAHAEPDAALQIVGDLGLFWYLHGHHFESLAWLRRVLAATPDQASPVRARALWSAATLALFGMELPGFGMPEAAAAIEMADATGRPEIRCRAMGMQGLLQWFIDPATAQATLTEAIALAEQAQDRFGRASALTYLSMALIMGYDRPQAAEVHLAALEAEARAGGSPFWASWAGCLRGTTAWRAGRLAEAAQLLTTADEAALSVGEPVQESWCARWLADVHTERGNYAAADDVVARSSAWQDRSSWGRLEWVLSRGVAPALARGDLAEARRRFAATEPAMTSLGMPISLAEVALLRGKLALADGDLGTARAAADAAGTAAATWDNPWYLAHAANLDGRVARAEGDLRAAEDAHHRALTLCADRGFAALAAETLDHLASLAAAAQSWTEAASLQGVIDALDQQTGRRRPPAEQSRHEADTAAVEAALGAEARMAAADEGSALDLAGAAAYAVNARACRRPTGGWDSLTPTELQVAALVTQGLTNAEIGDRLFVGAGTVKTHLRNIFRKLGVARRSELAARVTERRITET
jgi:predicted ATPase/class 3 adenylate cyclase/DNA-binding CsgD family transcriptional regulator